MRLGIVLALLLVSGSPAHAKTAKSLLEINPVVDPVSGLIDAVDYKFSFTGDADGETVVVGPSSWGGFNDLYKFASLIHAKGATLSIGKESHQLILRHKPRAKIEFSWRFTRIPKSDQAGGDRADTNDFRPIVTDRYFHLLGTTTMFVPEHLAEESPVIMRFGPMPEGMGFASDLQHSAPDGTLKLIDVGRSITVGGDFRVLDAGNGARLAIRGSFKSRDDKGWQESLARISRVQRLYWGTGDEPYLVTIMAYQWEGEGSSTGGTGMGDSFAFFATSGSDPRQLDDTMMHEMVHSWIPGRIGGTKKGSIEAEDYWFSEGFTDYVKMKTLVGAGFWDARDFAKSFNDASYALASSPLVSMPNSETAKLFWTDRAGKDLPYQRGLMFALMLDYRLRKHTDGRITLEQILRKMLASASAGDNRTATALLQAHVEESGVDAAPLIADHIEKGLPIMLPIDLFAPCGELAEKQSPRFDPGFDAETTLQRNNGLVSGVDEKGAAWRAGLRNGMQLAGWSIHYGDVTKEIAVDFLGSNNKPQRLIPTCIDHNPCAHLRCPMAMMRQG